MGVGVDTVRTDVPAKGNNRRAALDRSVVRQADPGGTESASDVVSLRAGDHPPRPATDVVMHARPEWQYQHGEDL